MPSELWNAKSICMAHALQALHHPAAPQLRCFDSGVSSMNKIEESKHDVFDWPEFGIRMSRAEITSLGKALSRWFASLDVDPATSAVVAALYSGYIVGSGTGTEFEMNVRLSILKDLMETRAHARRDGVK